MVISSAISFEIAVESKRLHYTGAILYIRQNPEPLRKTLCCTA
jgi:hypothetical protein